MKGMVIIMSDTRNNPSYCGGNRESVYIDTNRILDSCRDKDCFENVPVYLSECAGELIERATNVRTKCASILCANIHVDPIPFNRGFYQIHITMYIKLNVEICACLGRPQEADGIAIVEKKVILYGGEGNVNIFRSELGAQNFCGCDRTETPGNNLPTAVFEVVDPIVLQTKITDVCECQPHPCCINIEDLPERVCSCLGGRPVRDRGKILTVALGFFSVVRIERPAQYLVQGTEYAVPEKECLSPLADDPCKMFKHMSFPTSEFYPPSLCDIKNEGDCGCKR
jgi:hypothetical protein